MANKLNINANDSVTSRLPFEPFKEFGNFCLGTLDSVEFGMSKSDKEDSAWEYASFEFPRLSFHFKAYKLKETDPDRFFSYSEMPIAHIKTNGEEMKESVLVDIYTNMWRRVKHIHDQYATAENAKAIVPIDLDLDADSQGVLDATKEFFSQVADAFNKGSNDSKMYDDTLLAMKLIASGKNKNYLSFPNFVGTGFLEPVKMVAGKPTIKILKFKPGEIVNLGVTQGNIGTTAAAITNEADVPSDIMEQLKGSM